MLGAMISSLLGDTYGYATGLISGGNTLTPIVSRLFGSGMYQAFFGGFLLWFGVKINQFIHSYRLSFIINSNIFLQFKGKNEWGVYLWSRYW